MDFRAMLEADYLRRQAETCSYLSQSTFDLGLAGRLRALADELRRKANEIEHDEEDAKQPGPESSMGRRRR